VSRPGAGDALIRGLGKPVPRADRYPCHTSQTKLRRGTNGNGEGLWLANQRVHRGTQVLGVREGVLGQAVLERGHGRLPALRSQELTGCQAPWTPSEDHRGRKAIHKASAGLVAPPSGSPLPAGGSKPPRLRPRLLASHRPPPTRPGQHGRSIRIVHGRVRTRPRWPTDPVHHNPVYWIAGHISLLTRVPPGATLTTVGADPARALPGLAQAFRSQHYLKEIKTAIDVTAQAMPE
jgi:hypothetical protein